MKSFPFVALLLLASVPTPAKQIWAKSYLGWMISCFQEIRFF